MKKIYLIGILLILRVINIHSQPCPEKIQAILLVKVFSFVRELGGAPKSDIKIGVVNGGTITQELNTAAGSSKDKITVQEVTIEDIKGSNVLYIPKGLPDDLVSNISTLAKEKKIFTVAGDPAVFQKFDISFSFRLVGGKAKMMVNVPSSEAEGVKFVATLLKIAERKE